MSVLPRAHMPSLDGATEWLNSEPLGPTEVRGRVVVVNFWTLTCINWLRQEPYVRAWAKAYRDDGLIVLGVHAPEFSFEHELERVRRAVEEMAIDYPVALDNDFAVWRAFTNHYWPALYFVDRDGVIRDHHFGEGRYEQSEREIQKLLGIERDLVQVEGVGIEAEADWDDLGSPETYLGYERGERGADRADALRLNDWALTGAWRTTSDHVALEKAGGSISYRFHARDAHLVLSHTTSAPIPFRVLIDGKAPGSAHGEDVDEDGKGVLDAGRLYQLIRQREAVSDHTLEITFVEPGAEAYCFTFG